MLQVLLCICDSNVCGCAVVRVLRKNGTIFPWRSSAAECFSVHCEFNTTSLTYSSNPAHCDILRRFQTKTNLLIIDSRLSSSSRWWGHQFCWPTANVFILGRSVTRHCHLCEQKYCIITKVADPESSLDYSFNFN